MPKIIIKTFEQKSSYESTISDNATIRELRNTIADLLGRPWDMNNIANITDKNGINLGAIYHDDAPDQALADLFKRNSTVSAINTEELIIRTVCNLGPGFNRSTKQNPKGYGLRSGAISFPENPFFKMIMNPTPEMLFSSRLTTLGISADNIPKQFLDPITGKVMDTPVITSTQNTYDKSTIANIDRALKVVNLTDNPLGEILGHNLQLYAAMETFLEEQQLLQIQESTKAIPVIEQPRAFGSYAQIALLNPAMLNSNSSVLNDNKAADTLDANIATGNQPNLNATQTTTSDLSQLEAPEVSIGITSAMFDSVRFLH